MPEAKPKRDRVAYMRQYRVRKRAEAAPQRPLARPEPVTDDPAGALAAWSRDVLKVPVGHPRAGEPMELPDFGVDFLRDALTPGVREAALLVARKMRKAPSSRCTCCRGWVLFHMNRRVVECSEDFCLKASGNIRSIFPPRDRVRGHVHRFSQVSLARRRRPQRPTMDPGKAVRWANTKAVGHDPAL